MQVTIEQRPSNTIARFSFSAGEVLTAEGGSMVAMSPGLDMETTTHKKGTKGIGRALKRIFSGESFFLNHYTAKQESAELILSPTLNGDIFEESPANCALVIQGGSYLAHYGDVSINTEWQGFKNLLSSESLFWIKASGSGKIVFNAFGVVYPIDVQGEYVVDSGHVVAFEDTLNYELSKVGGSWLSSFLGGEGFILRFKGKGRVWCQSHSPNSFGHEIGSLLRSR